MKVEVPPQDIEVARAALENHYGRDLLQLALCNPWVCVGRMVTQAEPLGRDSRGCPSSSCPRVGWPGTLSSPHVSLASSQHMNVYLLEMPAFLRDACLLSVYLFT